jgi:hypothetical protein
MTECNSITRGALGINFSKNNMLGVCLMQEAWHKRHAIQIAAALPETREDALVVLDLARKLVESFLYAPQRSEPLVERERGLVVSLSSAIKGANF